MQRGAASAQAVKPGRRSALSYLYLIYLLSLYPTIICIRLFLLLINNA